MVQAAGGNVSQVLGGVDELGGQVESHRHRGVVVLRSQFASSGLAWPLPRTAAARPGRFDRVMGWSSRAVLAGPVAAVDRDAVAASAGQVASAAADVSPVPP